MKPLNRLGSNWDRQTRNEVNENWDIIEDNLGGSGEQSVEALTKAKEALNKANKAETDSTEAKNTAESVQTQLNNIVIESGTSDAEVIQARGEYDVLNTRLTQKENEFSSLLAQTDEQLSSLSINVMFPPIPMIGAKGDGLSDDRAAIQSCIDFLETRGGGELFFPVPQNFYSINSTHPDDSRVGLIIKSDYISFKGVSKYKKIIKPTVEMVALIYSSVPTRGTTFDSFSVDGDSKVDYIIKMSKETNPYMTFKNCLFTRAREANASLSCFLSTFDGCTFESGKIGIQIKSDVASISTSNTFNSCYAIGSTEFGFDLNYLTYSTLNSCAADFCNIAYNLRSCFGNSLNGIGAEGCKKILKAVGYRGLTINGVFGLQNGGTTALPTDYMFEFGSGLSATIAGVRLQESKTFNYLLGLTSNAEASENITVLDDSIKREDVYFVTNFSYDRPIRFLRDDESKKNETISLTPTELASYVTQQLRGKKVDHDITIQLSDGVVSTETFTRLFNISGSGTITIQGNPNDRSAVRLYGGYWLFRLFNVSATVILKNLTINNNIANTTSHIIDVKNSKLILDNVTLATTITCGNAINAYDNADVTVKANTIANGSFVGQVWNLDASSKISHEPRDSAPTAGAWNKGTTIDKLTLVAGGYSKNICITSGVPGTWKQTGQIEA